MTMSNQIELVFIPAPGMGHLLSTVEVAKRMVQHDHRICITILIINLPVQSSKIDAYVDSQTRDNPHPTRLTYHTFAPLSNSPDSTSTAFFATVIGLHKPLVKQAVEDRIQAGSPKPAGFVLDMFCSSMVDVANELLVPSYIFFTSGASLLNLMFHTLTLADEHGVDIATKFSDPIVELTVPGLKNKMSTKSVPGVFQDKEGGCDMILDITRRFRETKGILVNTYMELETYAIQALLDKVDRNIPAIYPVGPILELTNTSEQDKSSIMEWLDDQPESSVVFLCFGSMGSFDADQVKEIAEGLERSGHRFLWALRKPPPVGKFAPPSDSETFHEALPEGFVDRTADRGKIISWAPQVSVLAHPAVGGFVSHCGWNSTLESMWFGVPMATWPLYAEQQLNAFTLVKELELAVEIRIDYKKDWKKNTANFVVTAEEIENGIKKLMTMDKEMRERVKEVSSKGRKALEDGGSSYDWLGRFIEDVSRNVA